MQGPEKLLRWMLRYRKIIQPGMVNQFVAIRDNPDVSVN